MRVTNGNPLGSPLLLPVGTVICVQTLKAPLFFGAMMAIGPMFYELPLDNALWKFVQVWMPRMCASMSKMNSLEALERVAATL
jgi:hypothetical protein